MNLILLLLLLLSGQPAGPGSQQASSPDYNAWVDLYRQPMAYFNQGAPQTQAPGLQVSSSSSSSHMAFLSSHFYVFFSSSVV